MAVATIKGFCGGAGPRASGRGGANASGTAPQSGKSISAGHSNVTAMKGLCLAASVLVLLTLPCLLVPTASGQGSALTNLGSESVYTPPTYDRNYTVTDLAWSASARAALIAMGESGIKRWDPPETTATRGKLSAGTNVLEVLCVGNRMLAMDSRGWLLSLAGDPLTVYWSKDVLDGTPYDMAVDAAGKQLAIVGVNIGTGATVTVMDLDRMAPSTSWPSGLASPFASVRPTSVAWVPILGYGDHRNATLAIGTAEGKVLGLAAGGATWAMGDVKSPIVGMEWSQQKSALVLATRDGDIYLVYPVPQGAEVLGPYATLVRGTRNQLTSLSTTPLAFAVASTDGRIEVWDAHDIGRSQVIRSDFSINAVAWANSTHLLASNVWGRTVLYGPDRDNDTWADLNDAYPDDPTEWLDTDGDGVGDNHDRFPLDPSEQFDMDGDGVGDRSDVFPNDPTESKDSDGDGVGDNEDFMPSVNNRNAGAGLVILVLALILLPVLSTQQTRRREARQLVRQVSAWAATLGLKDWPMAHSTAEERSAFGLESAYRLHLRTRPKRLKQVIDAHDTTALNLEVGLRIQEGIVERGGVAAEAAFSRAQQLREQGQELAFERGRLARLEAFYRQLDREVAKAVVGSWPGLHGLQSSLQAIGTRVDRLDNALEEFTRASRLEVAEGESKVARGAFVPAVTALRVRGSTGPEAPERGRGLEAEGEEGAGPVPEEPGFPEGAPMEIPPTLGHVRARQALLIGSEGVELAVSVDNTLPDEIQGLVISFGIEGDALRHRGPYKRELGPLQTGRSVTITFHTVVNPPALREPQHLVRLRTVVTGRAGGIEVREELPAKATSLVTASIEPAEATAAAMTSGALGRSGVELPGIPASFVLRSLEFPSGLLPVLGGSLKEAGSWRVYSARTEDGREVRAGVVVAATASSTELLVEVRGPPAFPARDLAEEVADSVRYAILVDRRIRLRGDPRPLRAERVEQLGQALAEAYLGPHELGVTSRPNAGRPSPDA